MDYFCLKLTISKAFSLGTITWDAQTLIQYFEKYHTSHFMILLIILSWTNWVYSLLQFVSAGASVISQHVNRNISNPAEVVNVKQGIKSIEVSINLIWCNNLTIPESADDIWFS